MPRWLLATPIQADPVLAVLYTAAALAVAVLLLPRVGLRAAGPRRAIWTALAALAGALAGALLIWALVDVQDAFGAPADTVIRTAACAAGAALGLAAANLVRSAPWRKVVAVVAAGAAVLAGAAMINRDVAYYPTLGAALGDTGVHRLVLARSSGDGRTAAPATSRLGTVRIPGVVSRFAARDAWVYLPPAALRAHPRPLPVLVVLSGEPGGPSDVFEAGGLRRTLDAIAARHDGVAPIVVAPDQLGGYDRNPMCVDSPLGAAATYITVDVRRWVLANLPATSPDRDHWAVAGFSEGATCAAQFGAGDPRLFRAFIAVSPEWGPFDRSAAYTVARAFHGDRAAWRAAHPIAIMRRHHHYPDSFAVYAVGGRDRRYGRVAPAMAAESRRAGMRTDFTRLPDLAHNWNTGAAGLDLGIDRLLPVWGIG